MIQATYVGYTEEVILELIQDVEGKNNLHLKWDYTRDLRPDLR